MQKIYLILLVSVFLSACGNKGADSSESLSDQTDSSSIIEDISGDVWYVAAVSGINIREQAGTSSKVLKQLPFGTAVTVLESSGQKMRSSNLDGEWVKISLDTLEGFLFDGFLLPVELPSLNPPMDLKSYFKNVKIPIGNKEFYKLSFDSKTESYKKTKVSEKAVQVKEESDFFEERTEFAGGYVYSELIGYEYAASVGFFPGLTLAQGFLLARALYPQFGYEGCMLNLLTMDFPLSNQTFELEEACVFNLAIEKTGQQIKKISILNSDLAYIGLEIELKGNGVEIKSYVSL